MPMPKRANVDDYFERLDGAQRPYLEALPPPFFADPKAEVEEASFEAGSGFVKLPYGKDLPADLLKALMSARVEEYETTGAGWSDR